MAVIKRPRKYKIDLKIKLSRKRNTSKDGKSHHM